MRRIYLTQRRRLPKRRSPFLHLRAKGERLDSTKNRRGRQARRHAGYICFVAPSRSGVFWAIIKDERGVEYFAYGRSFMRFPMVPSVGYQVSFAPLPPLPGTRYPRAIEVEVHKKTNDTDQ
jgi:hypothetical protein